MTFYDAAYLELARGAGLALATLDEKLARAADAENVTLIAAAADRD
jgi:predicted nucleic acid-binding protein